MSNKILLIKHDSSESKLTRECPFNRHPEAPFIKGIVTMVGSNACQNCSDHVAQTRLHVVCSCKLPMVIKTLTKEVVYD